MPCIIHMPNWGQASCLAQRPCVHFIDFRKWRNVQRQAPLGKTRKIQTDKANKWQLHTLIMLIKRRTEHHCDVTANQDLSVNEEYNMIMDRDKESSDHLSLPMVLARTFRHRRQHFTSPRGLLAQKTVQGFMVAEMVWGFSLSWASCNQTETLFRLNFL